MNRITSPLYLTAIVFTLLVSSCRDDNDSMTPNSETPNILLIIADDLGKDAISGFSEGSIKPETPNIDAFRKEGISFSNFWVYPTCSPTRASIITGKYGYQTGVKWAGDELAQSEESLQKYISDNTNDSYATAIVGKWHLSGNNSNINPETFGVDYYSGILGGGVGNYYKWSLTQDGTSSMQTDYATEVISDLAIDWVNSQSKPWFLWLAYNAPHTPFHVPPSEMHNQGDLPDYIDGADPIPYYMAAIEAMDYQIGRLLDNIPEEDIENTTIIFIGDNGTPNTAAQAPFTNFTAKGSLYQGGINVPMFITGKDISRSGVDDNLVTSTDLFATISEIAGISTPQIHDSKSFKSLLSQSSTIRDFQYSEKNDGTTDSWTIRNNRYKLIVDASGNEEMYDLDDDAYEKNNLLDDNLSNNAANAKIELETELSNIRN